MFAEADNESSAIWESQQVLFPTHTHTCCVRNDLKRFFKQPWNILGKACATDRSVAFGSHIWHWGEETGFIVPLVRQCATLKHLYVCMVFSSDNRQASTPLCPSASHTLPLMGRFQLIGAWICLSKVLKFHQSWKACVKWDCDSNVSWDHIIMLCYGKTWLVGLAVHRYVRTHIRKHTQKWISLCAVCSFSFSLVHRISWG